MDEQRRYSIEQIDRFLKGFKDQGAKEQAIIDLQAKKILTEELETPGARLLIASVIDGINANVRRILQLSVEGFKANADAIESEALKINVAYDFLANLRVIYSRGEAQEQGIEAANRSV